MVNCAAFGCNNKAGKGSGLSFFHFPKDSNLRKQWIYYCRRKDFTPGDGHRLCSVHFSNKCYDQDPEMLSTLGLEYSFRKRLTPDGQIYHFCLRKNKAIQKNLVKCEGHMQNDREQRSVF